MKEWLGIMQRCRMTWECGMADSAVIQKYGDKDRSLGTHLFQGILIPTAASFTKHPEDWRLLAECLKGMPGMSLYTVDVSGQYIVPFDRVDQTHFEEAIHRNLEWRAGLAKQYQKARTQPGFQAPALSPATKSLRSYESTVAAVDEPDLEKRVRAIWDPSLLPASLLWLRQERYFGNVVWSRHQTLLDWTRALAQAENSPLRFVKVGKNIFYDPVEWIQAVLNHKSRGPRPKITLDDFDSHNIEKFPVKKGGVTEEEKSRLLVEWNGEGDVMLASDDDSEDENEDDDVYIKRGAEGKEEVEEESDEKKSPEKEDDDNDDDDSWLHQTYIKNASVKRKEIIEISSEENEEEEKEEVEAGSNHNYPIVISDDDDVDNDDDFQEPPVWKARRTM
jgi:hypothetical protein